MWQKLLTVNNSDPNLQRRGRNVINVALALALLMIISLPLVATRADPGPSLVTIAIGVLLVAAAIPLARNGLVSVAGWMLVIVSTLAVSVPPIMRGEFSFTTTYLLLPILISGIVLRPFQIWITVVVALALLSGINFALPAEVQADPATRVNEFNLALLLLITGGLSFIGARTAERGFNDALALGHQAEETAKTLEQLNQGLEARVNERTAELTKVLAEVEAQAAERQQLLDQIAEQRDLIREMSIPVLPVTRDSLVVPLVGELDGERLEIARRETLSAIERTRARTLFLDITGVPVVDTQVASGLLQLVQSARLLGTETTLIGVRPEVAQSIVSLGIELTGMRTAADLAGALANR